MSKLRGNQNFDTENYSRKNRLDYKNISVMRRINKMSFVSVFITKDFASIMSDGQITDDNKESVQEDYKKIIKVQDFLIGFTGNSIGPVELIKAAIDETVKTIIGNAIFHKVVLLKLIKLYLNKYCQTPALKLNIVLAGFDRGEAFINTITIENSEVNESNILLENNSYQLLTLVPFDYKLENGSEGIEFMDKVNLLSKDEITLDKIIEIQKEVNDYVSDNSDTVNKHTFSEFVLN